MTPRKNAAIDPMLEGHPEPFSEPRTIPTGWDLSGFINPPLAASSLAEMNGTAFERRHSPFTGSDYDEPSNAV
jgi:hypothetical protein